MVRHLAVLLAGSAALLTTPVLGAEVKLDVTVTSPAGQGFSAPIFTFSNLSSPGFDVTQVSMGGGAPWDFVFAPGYAAPYGMSLPTGGTRSLLMGEERLSDGNNGCTASIIYGMSGFNPGETFSFAADPEAPGCGSAVVDVRPFLSGDVIDIGVTFSNGISLAGHDWSLELIDPLGAPNADGNQRYRLTLAAAVPGSAVPEPATWAMTIAGFAMIGAGLRVRKMGFASARTHRGAAGLAVC